MISWYRTIREDELKDGSIRKVYHLVFETDDKSIVEKIEQFFYDVMDAKTEPNSSEKPNNCEVKNYCDDCLYRDTCDSKEFFYACTSKATISKMEQVEDEPQTEVDWKQRLCDMYGADRKSFDEAWRKYEADKVKDEPQTDCAWGKCDD